MKYLIAAFAILLLVFSYGCTQGSVPSHCKSLPEDRLANCIYNQAVMDQNPFYCYSIANIEQRSICIGDASSPTAKATLEKAASKQRNAIFMEEEEPQALPTPAPSTSPEPEPQQGSCAAKSGEEKDRCFKSQAVQESDLKVCEQITDSTTRESCISEIAIKTKDLDSCKELSDGDDQNLCNLYVKGDEQKG